MKARILSDSGILLEHMPLATQHYRELLEELTKREIKQRYKQSVLGYAWVLLNPLLQMVVMAFVFSRILPVGSVESPYPIFLYIGLLPWTLLSSSLVASANALIGNAGLLTKIYLPREVFVQSVLLAKMVDFFLAASVLVVFLALYQVPLYLSILWVVPIFILQSIFTYALALLIASLNVFYRDVQYLLNFVVMVWMYVTPVIYPSTLFPGHLQWVFLLNPMAVFITAYRESLLAGNTPDLWSLGLSSLITLGLYICAARVFAQLEGRFSDAL